MPSSPLIKPCPELGHRAMITQNRDGSHSILAGLAVTVAAIVDVINELCEIRETDAALPNVIPGQATGGHESQDNPWVSSGPIVLGRCGWASPSSESREQQA